MRKIAINFKTKKVEKEFIKKWAEFERKRKMCRELEDRIMFSVFK